MLQVFVLAAGIVPTFFLFSKLSEWVVTFFIKRACLVVGDPTLRMKMFICSSINTEYCVSLAMSACVSARLQQPFLHKQGKPKRPLVVGRSIALKTALISSFILFVNFSLIT